MSTISTNHQLQEIISGSSSNEVVLWLEEKIKTILEGRSTRELYMTYSLLAQSVPPSSDIRYPLSDSEAIAYLKTKNANLLEVSRIFLLATVLEENPDFFTSKVANLIQIADTTELETVLKFLYLLPHPENFIHTATEALRSNILSVFNAIALNNPYPGLYFNDQQWNQMYLKAAFVETDLSQIIDIEKKANAELARIISDYAHERWAASRTINPLFWRPVSHFLNPTLLKDMKRLLESTDQKEKYAAALCCLESNSVEATVLINSYPELRKEIEQKNINWTNLA